MTKPTVRVTEHQDGTRVLVSANGAEVWVRVTPAGWRMQVAIDEGDGAVDVEWSIRRSRELPPPDVIGPFVQSPRVRR